jgi:hypothetical protein
LKKDELLDISFQAIVHPELVYKTSREIQKAAYSAVLTFLLIVVTIQTCQGLDAFQFLLLGGPTSLALLLSLFFLLRGVTSFVGAELNRKENSVLFANSVLAQESDKSFTNYQMYNIRVLRTHHSGPYPIYIVLILMAVNLFIAQIVIDSSGEPLTGNMLLLFGLIISGYPFSTVTFIALIIFGIGVLGLGFRLFSDASIARWNSKSETQIQAEAEKLVATHSKGVQMTYEEGAKILKDAENGSPAAVEQTRIMTEGMNREITRFRKVRIVYILAIIIVSIIDIVIFLLP